MAHVKAHVSEVKKKNVAELSNLVKNKQTILLVSIKGIPASQYQEIVKKLRENVIVKMPKKSAIVMALDSSDSAEVKKLKEHIEGSTAILFSDEDAFDISAELLSKKTMVRAKAGQEAPVDIFVQQGPTELMPGPAITELGAVGLQVQIDKGKLSIKEGKVIVKQGEKISAMAAEVMNKLNIRPFAIGFIPLAAFDAKSDKIYAEIKIDKGKTLEELKTAFGKMIPFAVSIGYVSEETIKFLLSKAVSHEKALGKLIEQPEVEEKKEDGEGEKSVESEVKVEDKTEEKKDVAEKQEDNQTKSEEEK